MRKIIAISILAAAAFAASPAKADVACANTYINGNRPITCAPGSSPNRVTLVTKSQYHGAGLDGVAAVAVRYNNPADDVVNGHRVSTQGTGVGVWFLGTPYCFTAPPGGQPPVLYLNGTCPLYPDA